jgi:hypothetical protein
MADEERRERLRLTLASAQEALSGLVDDDGSDGLELLQRVVAYAQVVVEQTDPSLVTESCAVDDRERGTAPRG